MLITTDAIVLSLQPHSDKAHVLHAYTRAGGRVNYMVYGLGKKHPIGLYTPLTCLHITANHPLSGPPTLREATPSYSASGPTAKRSYSEAILQRQRSLSGLYKQTVRLFVAEVLYHVLRHPMPDEPMWEFIAQAVEELDRTDEPQNFHLYFLTAFAAKLGFAIPDHPKIPIHHTPYTIHPSPLTRSERQKALRSLCDYFAEHVETWQTPKSLDVLTEVFDG